MTNMHAAYKRSTLEQKFKHPEGMEKKIPQKQRPKKKAAVATLISGKIDFKTKAIKETKKVYIILRDQSNKRI